MDFMPEVIGGSESEEEKMPELEPVKIENVDIFDKPKETPATQKKQRKKRVMTEAQKEKLAQARVKALETRRKNSALKKEKKELEKIKKQQELEELRASVKKPTEKKVDEFQPKEEHVKVEEDPIIVDKKEDLPCDILGKEQPLKSYSLTQEQIEELQQNAIMNYDNVRKGRKKLKEEEKKKNVEKERQRQELMRLANRSTPQETKQNYWDNCY